MTNSLRQTAETITPSEINVTASQQSTQQDWSYETTNNAAGKKKQATSMVAFMMVVQSNDLFILGPASHSFAIMPLDQ